MKILIFAVLIIAATVSAYAADDSTQKEGLFSKGSFLSEAISSVTDKVGKLGSDDEKIVSNDAKGVNKDILEYDRDPLGRPLPKPRRDDSIKKKEQMKQDGADSVGQ